MAYHDHQAASVDGAGRRTGSPSVSRGRSFGTVVSILCYTTTVLAVLAWTMGLSVWLSVLLPLAILSAIVAVRLLPRVLVALFIVKSMRRRYRYRAPSRRAPRSGRPQGKTQ